MRQAVRDVECTSFDSAVDALQCRLGRDLLLEPADSMGSIHPCHTEPVQASHQLLSYAGPCSSLLAFIML